MLGVGWTSVILLIRSGQIDGRLVGGHRWFCTHDLVRRFLSGRSKDEPVGTPALDAWRQELAAGQRTRPRSTPCRVAACAEAAALEFANIPALAAAYRDDARRIIVEAARQQHRDRRDYGLRGTPCRAGADSGGNGADPLTSSGVARSGRVPISAKLGAASAARRILPTDPLARRVIRNRVIAALKEARVADAAGLVDAPSAARPGGRPRRRARRRIRRPPWSKGGLFSTRRTSWNSSPGTSSRRLRGRYPAPKLVYLALTSRLLERPVNLFLSVAKCGRQELHRSGGVSAVPRRGVLPRLRHESLGGDVFAGELRAPDDRH